MPTFKEEFPEGNVAELEIDEWTCNECRKPLYFSVVVGDIYDVNWQAICCNIRYTISPYVAVYNYEKL